MQLTGADRSCDHLVNEHVRDSATSTNTSPARALATGWRAANKATIKAPVLVGTGIYAACEQTGRHGWLDRVLLLSVERVSSQGL